MWSNLTSKLTFTLTCCWRLCYSVRCHQVLLSAIADEKRESLTMATRGTMVMWRATMVKIQWCVEAGYDGEAGCDGSVAGYDGGGTMVCETGYDDESACDG